MKRDEALGLPQAEITYRDVEAGQEFDMNFAEVLLRRNLDDLIQNDADHERIFRRVVVELDHIGAGVLLPFSSVSPKVVSAGIALRGQAELFVERRGDLQNRSAYGRENIE